MQSGFWIQKGQPALVLAPMEGVTDAPMRALLTEERAFTHCVTEFLRISGQVLPGKCYPRHAVEVRQESRTASGTPVIFQLLGGHPERLALSALTAVQKGAKAIDLNFGCPAPTVNNHDGGAALLRYPQRIEEIIRTVRTTLPKEIPVSAKLRLGYDDPEAIYENAERAEKAGAAWITIHGRTKTQGYRPPAYWQPIGAVIRRLSIPVIANGEIWTIDDFHRCQEETRAEHFMIGRGALANPMLAEQIAFALGLRKDPPRAYPTQEEWITKMRRFLELCELTSDHPNYAIKRLKQWMRYISQRQPFPDFDVVKRWEALQPLEAIRFPSPLLTR
jgi:tRNA-dihydrouridine synthase C